MPLARDPHDHVHPSRHCGRHCQPLPETMYGYSHSYLIALVPDTSHLTVVVVVLVVVEAGVAVSKLPGV